MLSKEKILQSIIDKTPASLRSRIINSDKVKDALINPFVKEYGEVIEFCLQPEKREIHLKILLVGEKEPIDVDILGYELIENAENTCILIKKCTTSREWMNVLAEKFLCGKELPIPKNNFTLLKTILV
jgi:hypothetical protein